MDGFRVDFDEADELQDRDYDLLWSDYAEIDQLAITEGEGIMSVDFEIPKSISGGVRGEKRSGRPLHSKPDKDLHSRWTQFSQPFITDGDRSHDTHKTKIRK